MSFYRYISILSCMLFMKNEHIPNIVISWNVSHLYITTIMLKLFYFYNISQKYTKTKYYITIFNKNINITIINWIIYR